MELQAFRQFLEASNLTDSAEVLLSQGPCGKEACLGFSLNGIGRDRLMSRLSGLISGFGYGADLVSFVFNSTADEFALVDISLHLPLDAPRLKPDALTLRAARLISLLKALASLSTARAAFNAPSEIPAGTEIFLMTAFRWEERGETGVVTLAAPPQAPGPDIKRLAAPCPKWKLDPAQPPASGPLATWQHYTLAWSFRCGPDPKDIQ